jgi:sugar phosphate isomerase/epimerase
MRIGDDGFFGLTYCTNIHPAVGWPAVLASLERHTPALKARLSPAEPFGIGLRLSADESRELLDRGNLERFADWLDAHGMYVFSINGFPFGTFHGTPVKADVHAPDWRDEQRVDYTLRLVEILARLLPADLDGSISTSPLSYKPWIDQADRSTWRLLARNLGRVADAMAETGRDIHLDLEPEPDGLLERGDEVVRFFEDWLSDIYRDRIGVCFDTCHMAVAHEEPAATLQRFKSHGIRVGKVQISAGLTIPMPPDRVALQQFADPVYLHQVSQRNTDGTVRQYPDLPDALQAPDDPRAADWRIHFHTPLFVDSYGRFGSTRDTIVATLAEIQDSRACRVLEIETYTWDVLPPDLKLDLTDSIAREYEWVLSTLGVRVMVG